MIFVLFSGFSFVFFFFGFWFSLCELTNENIKNDNFELKFDFEQTILFCTYQSSAFEGCSTNLDLSHTACIITSRFTTILSHTKPQFFYDKERCG